MGGSWEVILPHEPGSGNTLSLSRRFLKGNSCNTPLSAFGMMPSRMFLASTNHSLVLRVNGEHSPRKTPSQRNPCQERIANLAIREQLFLVWECEGWSVFD